MVFLLWQREQIKTKILSILFKVTNAMIRKSKIDNKHG